MEIILNGQKHEISDGCSAAELIASMDMADKRIAMEVNQEIVPRSTYADYFFSAGDKVEIVHAVGGG